jgi:mannose-6-phosphate isomerase-like protein (cupin superfamily)
MPIVDLATQPVTPTPYGRWQALNAPLGVTAFGVNAMVCDPGESIDTAHDETDTGQHEVYIVVAGRAEFQLGSEVSEVGPGTIVAAPDPAVPRSFRALEPRTRIVCIGAVPAADAPAFGEWIGQAAP